MTIVRFVAAATFLAGAWLALSILLIQAPWAPAEPMLQSLKLVMMAAAGLGFAVCCFSGAAALLGLAGMTVRAETAPKPYHPPA